eukprot:m.344514 g.344514  ORF g.344514 m.344514 type:complete len:354 (-) comp24585_c0_seq1:15-1076(-)
MSESGSRKRFLREKLPETYLDKFDGDKVKELLDVYGVAVISPGAIISADQAEIWGKTMISWIIKNINNELGDEQGHPLANMWNTNNLPYGPREGMMQSLVSHAEPMWEMREALYPCFAKIYGERELLTSIDGVTIHPPIIDDGDDEDLDWPHVDETDPTRRCIQAQVVLSDSTSCFRCTPGSQNRLQDILRIHGRKVDGTDPQNWVKFINRSKELAQVKALFEAEGTWQLQVPAPTGTVIFWRSAMIHSAQHNLPYDNESWRNVAYISQRPAKQYSDEDKDTLRKAATTGRTTNHLGSHIFSLRPGCRWKKGKRWVRCDVIESKSDTPEHLGVPCSQHTKLIRQLTAQEPWDK